MVLYNKKMDDSVFLQIRLERDTRDTFRKICKEKAINSSELVRQWIESFVLKEQAKENK